MSIRIDPEFRSLIPPMSDDERSQLEQNILDHGCRDPLVLWNGVLLDGHHRHEICTEFGLPFDVVEITITDRDAALDWIDANQLGRRNLTPDQMSLLRGRIYNRRKKPAHGREGREFSDGQNVHPKPTHEQLGEQFGVSGKTIQRDGKFAASVEAIRPHVPDIDRRVMEGDVSRGDVIEAAADPERAQERLVHNHRAQGTGDNEWYTPPEYIEAARRVLGAIDLDPASSDAAQERVQATAYFTIEDDGLRRPWHGRVWLNPPYAQPAILHFVERLVQHVSSGDVRSAVMLTHNYTDTRWFHTAASQAAAICFTRGRIAFVDAYGKKAAPTQGQAFFYYGDEPDAFAREFAEFGMIVKPERSSGLEAAADAA